MDNISCRAAYVFDTNRSIIKYNMINDEILSRGYRFELVSKITSVFLKEHRDCGLVPDEKVVNFVSGKGVVRSSEAVSL